MVENLNCVIYIHKNRWYLTKILLKVVETRSDSSNYELDRPLPKGKSKLVIELMKGELGGKIMTKFVLARAKTYSYLIDDVRENKIVVK